MGIDKGPCQRTFISQCEAIDQRESKVVTCSIRRLFQLSDSPAVTPPDSPGMHLMSRTLVPTDGEDHDSSGSEESSLSCIQSVNGWELVSKDGLKKLKGQEFLRRLQVSMNGEATQGER